MCICVRMCACVLVCLRVRVCVCCVGKLHINKNVCANIYLQSYIDIVYGLA